MLNTSSSEDDEYVGSSGNFGDDDQNVAWLHYEDRNIHKIDRVSKPQVNNLLNSEPLPANDKINLKYKTTDQSLAIGWKQMQYDQISNVHSPFIDAQRRPRLGDCVSKVTESSKMDFTLNTGVAPQDTSVPVTTSTHFSVSFESPLEASSLGARLSPVGSSCWSSEQHISPDLTSLMSSSTNSVSAGISLSSGRQHALKSLLHRQPSAGTGCSGGTLSTEAGQLQSASNSVRSAPLCASQVTKSKWNKQMGINKNANLQHFAPPPPSLVISDPEEEMHNKRLQLYVLAIRCIAYPLLNANTTGQNRRYLRVTKDYLNILKERFQLYLRGELAISSDEAFHTAVNEFFEAVLNSDRLLNMVKSGSCSMYDIREIFIANIEKQFQGIQPVEGLSKESVLSAWKIKFDQICRGGEGPCPEAMKLAVPQPEPIALSNEQLYELLMRTLTIEKYEHQILYNACQERSFPKMVHKEMEMQYIEEEKLRVNGLMRRLDSIPALKTHSTGVNPAHRHLRKHPIKTILSNWHTGGISRSNRSVRDTGSATDLWSRQLEMDSSRSSLSITDDLHLMSEGIQPSSMFLTHEISREAMQVSSTIEILVHQVRNIQSLPRSKKLYCAIELDSTPDRKRTESVEVNKPVWNTTAEFQTSQILPVIKVKVFKECSGPLTLDDKELGRVTFSITWSSPRTPLWYKLQNTKHCHDPVEIQISVSMQRPTNCKYSNYCWIQGRSTFKKWKRRYVCIIQISQYTSILAAFAEQKSQPSESVVLDGFTVDYCEPRTDLMNMAAFGRNSKPEHHGSTTSLTSLSRLRLSTLGRITSQRHVGSNPLGGLECDYSPRFFFKLVREGDTIIIASSAEVDRQNWIQALYRATGQTHKPTLPGASNVSAIISDQKKSTVDIETGQNKTIDRFASIPIHTLDHLEYFIILQSSSLDYRLTDPFVSLGCLSPTQRYLLDEYCTRYGIRECQRHLAMLINLLNKIENGMSIDPDLIHISYSLCANHVSGKAQHDQAVHTVLAMERDQFQIIRTRLTTLLEKQITEFRYCFPFGRPEGALEKTISLLERVLTKETGEPASAELVRNVIRNCLRNAAVLNYERISEYVMIEDTNKESRKIHEMYHLAELCIEVLKQNEQHHSESFSWFNDLFVEHTENFWYLFQMDLFELLDRLPEDCWEVFDLFQLLNNYLLNDSNLSNGRFHYELANRFTPLVDRYIGLMADSIEQALIEGCTSELRINNISQHKAESLLSVHNSLASFTKMEDIGKPNETSSINIPAFHHTDIEWNSSNCSTKTIQNKEKLATPQTTTSTGSELYRYSSGNFNMIGSQTCQTVIELLWRLYKLKKFIHELNWPQSVLAEALDERVTLIELESLIRKCAKTVDLILPLECFTMLNTISELRAHLFSLCHPTDPVNMVINNTSNNITRSHRQPVRNAKPNDEEGQAYGTFLHINLQNLSENLVDEVSMLSMLEIWYTRQMKAIYDWLIQRKSILLHPHQIKCLSIIVKKIFSAFELQGLPKNVLNTIVYQTVIQRIQVEETTQCVKKEARSSGSLTSSTNRNKLLSNLGESITSFTGSPIFHRS
ncbi:calcium-dependent secretion activator [Schistosoma bovis]|uniref:Calcium-dependent secretion activator n=1 Tax=Schistosoma bovis TaxID=6184 RepID=A0A430QGG2_SCHBO|nr:calcium-dependent secretion activator [Schistosoma bovis]